MDSYIIYIVTTWLAKITTDHSNLRLYIFINTINLSIKNNNIGMYLHLFYYLVLISDYIFKNCYLSII